MIERRSLLDRKVAVLPLLCAASLLLASFWTPAGSPTRCPPAATTTFRLRMNASSCLLLVVTLLALRFMLPAAGGALPLVIQFNTGLVVLTLIQLAMALALGNLVTRPDSPPSWLAAALERVAPLLCLGELPLVGRIPSVVPPWAHHTDTQALQVAIGGGCTPCRRAGPVQGEQGRP